jgi:hypothetical protein
MTINSPQLTPRFADFRKVLLAMLEHAVEPVIGKETIGIFKDPVEQRILLDNLCTALDRAEKRFIANCLNQSLARALMELPMADLPSIQKDFWEFCKIPTSQALAKNLKNNLHRLNPNAADVDIDATVEDYMRILREEIVVTDPSSSEKIQALATLGTGTLIAQLSNDVEQIAEIVKILSKGDSSSLQRSLLKGSRELDDIIEIAPISFPVNIDFHENCEDPRIYTPPLAHRRVVGNALEFGSLVFFEQSWASLGNIRIPYFDLEFEAAFRNTANDGWIGVGFRSQSYYANFEHLFYLKQDGSILLTQPNEIPPAFYTDEWLRKPVPIDKTGFHHFHVRFTPDKLFLSVDDFSTLLEVINLPKVFGPGRIMFQSWPSWMAIKGIRVSII